MHKAKKMGIGCVWEVVRHLLINFLYHALYLIIYIGYEIGIAQHFDVVVKAKHEAANA